MKGHKNYPSTSGRESYQKIKIVVHLFNNVVTKINIYNQTNLCFLFSTFSSGDFVRIRLVFLNHLPLTAVGSKPAMDYEFFLHEEAIQLVFFIYSFAFQNRPILLAWEVN